MVSKSNYHPISLYRLLKGVLFLAFLLSTVELATAAEEYLESSQVNLPNVTFPYRATMEERANEADDDDVADLNRRRKHRHTRREHRQNNSSSESNSTQENNQSGYLQHQSSSAASTSINAPTNTDNKPTPLTLTAVDDIPSVPQEPPGYQISFNNLAITEVLRFVSQVSGKNFIYNDEDMAFPVTIVSSEPISLQNLLAAIMQVLRVRGLIMLEQGNNILIHPSRETNRIPRLVGEGFDDFNAEETQIETRIFRLTNIAPEKISKLISTLLSKDAKVLVLPETRNLIVTDFATNMLRVEKLVKDFDDPHFGKEIGQYLVKNRHIDPLMQLLQQILEPMIENTPTQIFANTESNSIFIISTPYVVERALAILQTLDMTSRQTRIMSMDRLYYLDTDKDGRFIIPDELKKKLLENETGSDLLTDSRIKELVHNPRRDTRLDPEFFGTDIPTVNELTDFTQEMFTKPTDFKIYKLQNRTAESLKQALKQIGESLGDADPTKKELVDAIKSIEAIQESNSLVFTGSSSAVERVKYLIQDLDVPLRQVLIEVLILETTVSNSFNFGVQWNERAKFSSWANSAGFLNSGSPLPTAIQTADVGNSPDAVALSNIAGFSIGAIGRVLRFGDLEFMSLGALVNAIQDDSYTDVVMNPKILTEDNSPAELFVGVNTRFKTQSISNDQGSIITSNFEFRDVGSTLKVTPFLGDGDIVTLEITQEISSVLSSTTTQSQEDIDIGPTTRISRTSTRVHVPNENFLILSGMIAESKTRGKTGLPCLGGIPVIGDAAGSRRRNDEKQALIMFIRPIIVDSLDDVRRVTRNQHALYREKAGCNSGSRFQYNIDTDLDILKSPCHD